MLLTVLPFLVACSTVPLGLKMFGSFNSIGGSVLNRNSRYCSSVNRVGEKLWGFYEYTVAL